VPRDISRFCLAAALVAIVLASARLASAQPASRPDRDAKISEAVAHFERGRALMTSRKYAEACDAFAHSQALDPGWGTLYNLARCRELEGKLATSLAFFRELARPDTYPALPGEVPPERDRARRKDAGARASALDKRVARLRLTSRETPAGLVVTVDGVDVTSLVGTDQPVDLGVHQVHAAAPARKPLDTTVEIRVEPGTTTVALELTPADPPSPIATPPAEPIPSAPGSGPRGAPAATAPVSAHPTDAHPTDNRPTDAHPTDNHPTDNHPTDNRPTDNHPADEPGRPGRAPRATYGLITAAEGGGLVVTGLVFGQLASSRWQSAQDQCSGRICSNADSLNGTLVDEARTRATVSTVLVVGGAAAIGVAAYLYFTAPQRPAASLSTALHLTPAASPETVSLTLAGQF
jgi:hypothetical protein